MSPAIVAFLCSQLLWLNWVEGLEKLSFTRVKLKVLKVNDSRLRMLVKISVLKEKLLK